MCFAERAPHPSCIAVLTPVNHLVFLDTCWHPFGDATMPSESTRFCHGYCYVTCTPSQAPVPRSQRVAWCCRVFIVAPCVCCRSITACQTGIRTYTQAVRTSLSLSPPQRTPDFQRPHASCEASLHASPCFSPCSRPLASHSLPPPPPPLIATQSSVRGPRSSQPHTRSRAHAVTRSREDEVDVWPQHSEQLIGADGDRVFLRAPRRCRPC